MEVKLDTGEMMKKANITAVLVTRNATKWRIRIMIQLFKLAGFVGGIGIEITVDPEGA